MKEENYDQRADVIVKAFQFWQKCWADELNARPTEEKATIKGKHFHFGYTTKAFLSIIFLLN